MDLHLLGLIGQLNTPHDNPDLRSVLADRLFDAGRCCEEDYLRCNQKSVQVILGMLAPGFIPHLYGFLGKPFSDRLAIQALWRTVAGKFNNAFAFADRIASATFWTNQTDHMLHVCDQIFKRVYYKNGKRYAVKISDASNEINSVAQQLRRALPVNFDLWNGCIIPDYTVDAQ